MRARVLLVGWDGAGWPLLDPWLADGRLPNLRRLAARGAGCALRSTLPIATFPAWTSLVTGMNPGRHGVLDFAERIPGSLRVRFVNGSWRRTPALWNVLSDAGRRVAVVTVPATYPPETVRGLMVSGFDTPLTAAVDGSFVQPRERWPELRRLVGRLPFADFQEVATGEGWHERALASLLDGIERRTRLMEAVLRNDRPDFAMVVFGESDTVAHHFWRFHDPASPRYAPSPWGAAVRSVYEALDASLGRLVGAAGEDAAVMLVSDHGSGGASDRILHPNRRLADAGLLGFETVGVAHAIARRARMAAVRTIPFRWQAPLLRRLPGVAGRLEGSSRFGGIDWDRTVAFSDELDYHPCVWVNLRGREPRGTVPPAEYEAVCDRVVSALRTWTDADGRSMVARVWRRAEVMHGPATERAPDLLIEPALVDGYRPSIIAGRGPGPAIELLPPDQYGAGKTAGMNGTHRREGIFLAAGPGVADRGRLGPRDIADVMPTVLALAGLAVPADLDGRAIDEALRMPVTMAAEPLGAGPSGRYEYDEAGEAEIADRLAALGYLDRER